MDRTAQNPGFFVSGGQVFLSSFSVSFDESLSRRLVSGYTNLGLHSALLVFLGPFSLEVAGHVLARTFLDASSVLVLDLLELLVSTSENYLPAQLFFLGLLLEEQRAPGGRWQFSGSQQSAGAGGIAPRAGAVSAGAIDLAEREHFAGCAGRHGEEQRAPGGWRALRLLPRTLRQARQVDCHIRESSENLSTLSSSLVPHARLFSLHPSLVSQNSSLSHGLGAMNSCNKGVEYEYSVRG